MKDFIITWARVKKELLFLCIIFVLSNIANLAAIITYKSPFTELFTSLGYVVIFTGFIYLVIGIFRIIGYLIVGVIKPKVK